MLKPGQVERLERLVDETSLRDVLEALSDICAKKAEHVSNNWQDEALAKLWSQCASAMRNVSNLKTFSNM